MCRPYLCALRGCCCLQLGVFKLDMMNLLGQFFRSFCGLGKPEQVIQRQTENAAQRGRIVQFRVLLRTSAELRHSRSGNAGFLDKSINGVMLILFRPLDVPLICRNIWGEFLNCRHDIPPFSHIFRWFFCYGYGFTNLRVDISTHFAMLVTGA